MILSAEEFEQRLALTRMTGDGKTAVACRMVLVKGVSVSKAAASVGIATSVVSRGVGRLKIVVTKDIVCPKCGHRFGG